MGEKYNKTELETYIFPFVHGKIIITKTFNLTSDKSDVITPLIARVKDVSSKIFN